jgi:hypothetical protein
MVNNAVLEEDVVCGKRERPCCRGGCHERHMNTETDLGSHVADWFSDRCAKVIDHKWKVKRRGEVGVSFEGQSVKWRLEV